ncbi:hypothetical protein MLD38_024904 [Melastoma candidum]|uniref:Uncharacterized protein n=1 Tax=Melastoma candidum TaxID=119954 RepID=A0ACB9NUN6_9MYRT|nr:hypothetical protein MLD38_024904 [Melastoma candidum]
MGPGRDHYSKAEGTQMLQRAFLCYVLVIAAQIVLNSPGGKTFDCTTWSGAGPGLMDAATEGAWAAGHRTGIGKEAGEWTASNFHPYRTNSPYNLERVK